MLLFFPIDATIFLILSLVILYIQKIQLILLYMRVDIAWYLLVVVDATKLPFKIVDIIEVPVLIVLVLTLLRDPESCSSVYQF